MKRLSFALRGIGLLPLLFQLTAVASAQQIDFPRPSPDASISQTIGLTEITLHYSRPGVKGRKIWGGVVPFGQVWRTGANENTTIRFTTAAKVEGHEVPAGLYGVQTIPTDGEWTLILTKDNDKLGAFSYKPENDVLRVQLKPQPAELQERMGFEFTDLTDTSAKVVLRWEKLAVPFTITVDTPKLVETRAKAAIGWRPLYQAASYCLQNNVCLDEAGGWLDASISLEGNFSNYRAKAELLAGKGDFHGAVANGEKALAAAKKAATPPPADAVSAFEKKVSDWRKK
ncbi:MAG TPA: DUF2911 domain-containing protein [Thermoanaerobaculia bacterium]|nr:DUF2911 domain-containing protein [Thermoanaerobaculia bacterium]